MGGALLGAALWAMGLFAAPERWTYDQRLRLLGVERDATPFTVVLLDDKTHSLWQEPLALWGDHYASLLKTLLRNGARGVVFDLVHAADPDPYLKEWQPNSIFGEAILEHERQVVLGTITDPEGRIVRPAPELLLSPLVNDRLGYVELPLSADGVVRKVSRYRKTDGKMVAASLAFRAASLSADPKNVHGPNLIQPDLTRWRIETVSASSVRPGMPDFRNRVVIVGFASAGDQDVVKLPVIGERSGAELQARIAASFWRGSDIVPLSSLLLATLVASICFIGVSPATPLLRLIVGGFWIAISILAFALRVDLPLVGPSALLFLSAVGGVVGVGYEEKKLRRQIRSAFDAQLDPATTEFLLAESAADQLGAVRAVTATILFLDVRGSTTVASQMEPSQFFGKLNSLFEEIVPLVAKHGGVVLGFNGDGFLAVFGGFQEVENDPRDALRCAEAMLRAADGSLEFGIGIHRGPFMLGNLGSRDRLQFTAIGDAVNIAARIESSTKSLKCRLAVSQSIAERVPEVSAYPSAEIELRNHPEPVTVFLIQ